MTLIVPPQGQGDVMVFGPRMLVRGKRAQGAKITRKEGCVTALMTLRPPAAAKHASPAASASAPRRSGYSTGAEDGSLSSLSLRHDG
jgi:hypothetical protein